MKIAVRQKSGFRSFLEGLGEILEAVAEASAEEYRKEEARKQFLARNAGDVEQIRFELMQFKQELMKMEAQNEWRMTSEERYKLHAKKEELEKMIRLYEQALRSPAHSTHTASEIHIGESDKERMKRELFELKKEAAILNANYLNRGSEGDKRAAEVRKLIELYERELHAR